MSASPTTAWDAWRLQRDDAAFERLVRPVLPALYDAACRHGLGRADAEDVVQEALLDLAGRRDERPAHVGIGAWLMRCVRLKSLSRRRGAARRARHERAAPSRAPAEVGGGVEVRDEVEHALSILGEEDRQLLAFRFLYDLDYRDLAYVLGRSENACRIRVHRAAGKLRALLGPRALAFMAAVPLPDPPGGVAWLTAATSSVSPAPAAALLGGWIVSTSTKLIVAAGLGAALSAGAILLAQHPRAARVDDEPPPVEHRELSAAPEPTLQGRVEEAVADLDPTEEEVAWLRERLQEERARREAAHVRAGDSGLDILDRVLDQGLDPWPLLADFDAFQSHVQPSPGPEARFLATGDVTKVDLASVPADTALVVFGPGVFDVTGMRVFQRRKPVSHLEIRGAGKDETTLRMGPYDELMVGARYEHVRIEGLTLDWHGQRQLLDVREEIAVVLQDVRLREWHSDAIYMSGRAYLGCRHCEFTNGLEGRGGALIWLRGPALATFTDCTFSGLEDVLLADTSAQGGRVLLQGCTYEDSPLTDSRSLRQGDEPAVEIRVEGADVTLGASDWSDEKRAEKWGRKFAASTSGLSLRPSVRRLSLGGLRDVLALVPVPSGSVLVLAQLTGWASDGPTGFVLATWAPGQERTTEHVAERTDGRTWEIRTLERAQGRDLKGWPDPGQVPDLRNLLERLELPAGTVVRSAGLQSYVTRDSDSEPLRTVWDLVVDGDGKKYRFDPRTLEAVQAPR